MGKTNNKDKEQETNNGINLIGLGTRIEGDINSSSDIRIDGELSGNINTSGKLVIGESGKVDGELYCKNGDISGTIEGKIHVAELLSLKASARVQGDMVVNQLAIEPGCKFTGNCQMDNASSTNERTRESQPKKEQSTEEKSSTETV